MALSKGCTIALIVIGVIVVLIVVALIIIWMNKDRIVEAGVDYMVDQIESGIVADLPEGYTAEQVHQIMDEFKTAVKAGEVDQLQLQELGKTIQAASADKEIDQEEGTRILAMVEEAIGMEPAMPEEVPDSLQAVPDTL